LDKCWYSKNSGTTNLSVQACTTNFTHVVSTEGWNNWTVYANDTVGNENSSLVNFFKDSVNPAVTVHSPTAGLSSSSEILFNVTATDAGSVDECWVTIDSGATNTSLVNDVGTDYYDATNSSVPDNSYTAQFYCNDSLGNLNDSLTVAFSVDSTAPALTIVYPENGTNHTTDVSELNFSVSDGGTLDKCWYSKDGGTNNLSVQACTSNFTSVVSTEGWNNWTVFANDIAGNENSSLVEFFKDSVNPGVTINLPTATTYLVGSYAVNITLDEVGYCEYSVNGGAANTTLTTTDDLTFTRSVTGAANAAYTLVAYCNDSYGNNNYTTNVTFTVAVPAAATGGSSGTDEVEVDIEEEESVEIEEVVDEKVCGEWGECISDVQKRDCVSGSGVESVETQECACVPEWVCTSNQECVGSLDIHSMPDVSFGCSWSDMNQDGKIDVGDLAILSANWNRRDCSPSNSWCNLADINRNGEVGLFDQMFLVRHFDTSVRDCDPSVPVSESVGYVINSCEDLHECGDILSKPEEVVECSVGCEEEWVCNWSVPCVGGFITPVCEDSNSCGTFSSMPSKITCEVLDEFEYLNEEQKETSSSPSSSGRSGSVCVPDIACDKWSECEVNYNFEDLLSGVENVEGVQSRTCVDNNGCVVVDKEEKMCLVKAEIYIELERVCNDYYIKVYDMWTGKLLARVRDRRFEDMPSLDVLFNSAEDKICDSCFNGLLDQGEEGVDCGGLCKSCDDWSYSLNLFEKLMWRLGG